MINERMRENEVEDKRALKIATLMLSIVGAVLIFVSLYLYQRLEGCKLAYASVAAQYLDEKSKNEDTDRVREEADKTLRDVYRGLEACVMLYEEPQFDGENGWGALLSNDEWHRVLKMHGNMEWLVTDRYMKYHDIYGDEEGLKLWAARSNAKGD